MKYLKLFVTFVLLVSFVTSLTFAGKSNGVSNNLKDNGQYTTLSKSQMKSMVSKATRVQELSILESDKTGPIKSNGKLSKQFDREAMAKASPTPRIEVSSVDPLAGTYQIPGDFSSIGSAVAVLNYVGVSADVTFELTATTYNELSVTFGAYAGNGDYTVTVQPAAGVAATVNFVASNSDGKGFAFNGASNVTIDGLNSGGSSLTLKYAASSVFPTGDPFGSTVYITGASTDIAIKNASVEGIVDNAVWANHTDGRSAIFLFSGNADPDALYDITLDGLTITNASFGIKCLPEGLFIPVVGLTINGCNVGDAFGEPVHIGGWFEYATIVDFTNNTFDGITFLQTYWYVGTTEYQEDVAFAGVGPISYDLGQATGFHFIVVDAGTFYNNVIKNVSYAGSVGDGTLSYGTRTLQGNNGLNVPALFYNNRISDIYHIGGAGSQINGLRGTTGNVFHNSISIGGSTDANTGAVNGINGVSVAYNNAISVTTTGPIASRVRAIATGGTYDYNAFHSSGYPTSAHATIPAAVAAGINPNGLFGPVNFGADLHITSGPSSAENIGKPLVLLANDIDGDARDTSVAGTRDAGADEFANTGSLTAVDVFPTGIPTPLAAGVPTGLATAPTVVVKNNSNQPSGSFDTRVQITDGYDQTVTTAAGIPAGGSVTVTFPNWIPPTGSWTITATTLLSDADNGNNATSRAQVVVAPLAIVDDTTFSWNSGDEGWSRAVDWKRSSTFSKLGGPFDGASMVTERPNLISTYTEGAYASSQGYATTYPGANFLTSPWLDISGMSGTDVYISFFHSISTEPLWDRSWVEYTTDGVNWFHVGVLDEPNGTNWYNTAKYAGAQIDPANFDYATAIQYGIAIADEQADWPSWTSNNDNADFTPTGPNGWVYAAIKLAQADYPNVIGAPVIKFRYVAFSDAASSFEGWAIDNFRIGNTPTALAGGNVKGKVFHDVDGNGLFDGADTPMSGVTVYVSSGDPLDTLVTDGSGDYSYNISGNGGLPGLYTVEVDLDDYGFTVPLASNKADVSHPSDGNDQTQNFGAYQGSVSGTKFSDTDDGADYDLGEPGLAGWTIELHADSANGALRGTAVTDVNGEYTINAPPGNYVVKEIAQASVARQTYPTANSGRYNVTISGNSGSGTALSTGNDFGNFVYATIVYWANIDANGDGLKSGPFDTLYTLRAGDFLQFKVRKDGIQIDSSYLGDISTIFKTYGGLDLGTYSFHQLGIPDGYVVTNGSLDDTVVVNQSGMVVNVRNFHFRKPIVAGYKFNDLDGDGVKDVGEPGLAGWTINVDGPGGGALVTDSTGYYTCSIDPIIDTVFVYETEQSGWTRTTKQQFRFFPSSQPFADDTIRNFGNFQNYSVSGKVWRDYNGDGIMNGGDAGMSGVTVTLTGSSNVTTDGDGNYTFTGVSNDTKNLAPTAPVGFVVTAPDSGDYAITGTSGTNVTGMNFGLLQSADATAEYRTFTLDSLQANAPRKAIAKPKKVTDVRFPNLVNMLEEIFKQAKDSSLSTGIIVGEAGNKVDPSNSKSKEKGYIKPSKASEVQATLYKKGKTGPIYQTGTARGLDFLVKNEARILKLNKSLAPDKHNNVLVGNLMTLGVNIAASDFGKTEAGFGDLVYIGGGDYNGMSVYDIYLAANDLMTNWEFVPTGTYTALNSLIASLNAEFSSTTLDTVSWVSPGKLVWTGVKPVTESSILAAGSGASPRQRVPETYEETPSSFSLAQNFPNPFNPTTTLRFALPEQAVVTVKVFNLLGQEVATVIDNEEFTDGNHDITFDATNLTSGVYFYRVTAVMTTDEESGATQHFTETKKMLLTK